MPCRFPLSAWSLVWFNIRLACGTGSYGSYRFAGWRWHVAVERNERKRASSPFSLGKPDFLCLAAPRAWLGGHSAPNAIMPVRVPHDCGQSSTRTRAMSLESVRHEESITAVVSLRPRASVPKPEKITLGEHSPGRPVSVGSKQISRIVAQS